MSPQAHKLMPMIIIGKWNENVKESLNYTNGDGVEEGAHDRKEEYSSQMIEKRSIGHEISSIQDDGRQHTEEEDAGW